MVKNLLERLKDRLNNWLKSLGLRLKSWLNNLNNLLLRLRLQLKKRLKNLFERLKMQLNNWRESRELNLKMWRNSRPNFFGADDKFAFLVLILGLIGYFGCPIPGWYKDIRSELIGIGVSVLIITNAGEYESTLQEKRRLILQMGSPDNAFAIEAVRQLRVRGWLYDGSLSGADLLHANLRGAFLLEADLSYADLSYARLDNRETNLEGANLRCANLLNGSLKNAQLYLADLSGANLSNADLSGTSPIFADLSGAIYSQHTKWPDSFDPVAAGAILIEE